MNTTDKEIIDIKEMVRVLQQFHNIKSRVNNPLMDTEIADDRRQEYLSEDPDEDEESDYEHHTTYIGQL